MTNCARNVLFFLCVGWLLSGCALPKSRLHNQSSVDTVELQTIVLVRRGLSDFKKGRALDAEISFRRALYYAPSMQNIRRNLALALEAQSRYAEASQILLDLSKLDPESLDVKRALARVSYSAGDFARAEELYLEALEHAQSKGDKRQETLIARSLSAMHFAVGNEQRALCYSLIAHRETPDRSQLFRHARLLNALHLTDWSSELLQQYAEQHIDDVDPEMALQFSMARYDQADLPTAQKFINNSFKRSEREGSLSFEIVLAKEIIAPDNKEEEVIDPQSPNVRQDERLLEWDLIGKNALYWPSGFEAAYGKFVSDLVPERAA